jgi:hypothetical protein
MERFYRDIIGENSMPKESRKGKRHVFLALSNPVKGREDAFEEWYEKYHVPECVQVPGFVSGQRFALSANQGGEPTQRHLALYELEGDDPQAILDKLMATREQRTQGEVLDRSSLAMWVFTEVGDKFQGNGSGD